MHKINIEGGNPATGELHLSDNGHTKAWKNDLIRWKVKTYASPVKSIVVKDGIILKDGTVDIFDGPGGSKPHRQDDKVWFGTVKGTIHINRTADNNNSIN